MQSPKIPYIPESAPFSFAQRVWLNGYLAGLFSEGDQPEQQQKATPITILWGSQTGNTEALAKKTAKQLKAIGFDPSVVDMVEYDTSNLSSEKLILLMTSTYGEGDPPDNAEAFYEFLIGDEAGDLNGVNYAVLALGDTNYADYCKAGRVMDDRMTTLGATPVLERAECNVDYEETYDSWISNLKIALEPFASAEKTGNSADGIESEDEDGFDKTNPYQSKVSECYKLNGEGSSKDVRHVTFDLGDSGIHYQAGDAIGVFPWNCGDLVEEILGLAKLDPQEEVMVSGEAIELKSAFLKRLDINNLSRTFIENYLKLSGSPELEDFYAKTESDGIDDYVNTRQIIDLLEDYPPEGTSAQPFVDIFSKLQPRLYSISSSPKIKSDLVSATVGTVRYETLGRRRKGVCSTFLADRLPEDHRVEVFIHENKAFRPPEDDTRPMIMVGPGTGIAPFRAFLQEREARKAGGKNWLFFGDQHVKSDFLYQELLEGWRDSGLLTRMDTAFSRDQASKIYVQDRMLKNGQEIFEWLEEGAYFYVCGDASRMAKDVDAALFEIIKTCGKMDETSATAYLKELKKQKRYQRDVY